MKQFKGDLLINNAKFEKEVTSPTVKDVLLAKREELLQIEDTDIHIGEMTSVRKSTFYAYAASVKSIKDVWAVYKILKNKHTSATHIICGYHIFGAQYYNLQDYSKDGEHGGGDCILKALKLAKVWNLAVFVVRYHEGPNIGKQRFEIISELTKGTIASFPHPLDYGARNEDKQMLQAFEKMDREGYKRYLTNEKKRRGSSN